jgi:hypothetical protein
MNSRIIHPLFYYVWHVTMLINIIDIIVAR